MKTSLGFKALVPMLAIAGLSMGNQKCEQAPTERLLKMNVEIGSLKGRAVKLPDGTTVDFPYVANALFYRQVIAHDHFYIMNEVPTARLMAANAGKLKVQSTNSKTKAPAGVVSKEDVAVLEQYGLLNSTRARANAMMFGKSASTPAEVPECLYNAPQAILGGEVISFEATWGVGLGVGYNSGGDLSSSVGGKVDFKSSKLELGLRTDDPLTRRTFAIGDGISHQSDVSFGIDFLSSLVGIDFFYNTPITDVIRAAMTDGLDQIAKKYITTASVADWNHTWETRVLYDEDIANNDTHVGIRAGSLNGLQNGDIFTISNMHYKWMGAACSSPLDYSIATTTTPIATGKVVNIGPNVAVLEITYLKQDVQILPGAQVKLLTLNVPANTKTSAAVKK